MIIEARLPLLQWWECQEESDRKRAWDMANDWQEKHIGVMMSTDVLQDFICHQSDVIEMLAHALSFANKKLNKINRGVK